MMYLIPMFEGQFIGSERILEALKMLNARLVYTEHERVELLICGGAALNLTGVILRTTQDIDSICCVRMENDQYRLVRFEEDADFELAVNFVSRALRLPSEWLNFAPRSLFDFGLPTGTEQRMGKIQIGECLTIYTVSRQEQIALKVYAAMAVGEGNRVEVHLSDLMELRPTREEFEFAKSWLLSKRHSPEFEMRLFSVMERVGYVE